MERFRKKRRRIEPLAPAVSPTEEVYDRSFTKLGIKNTDIIKELDKTAEQILWAYEAPALIYTLVPESAMSLAQYLGDLKNGPMRSPLMLGYTANAKNGTSYSAVLTMKRGDGSGNGGSTAEFVRKRKNGVLESCNYATKKWKECDGPGILHSIQKKGNGGNEFVLGLCEFFDGDIFHIDAAEAVRLFRNYSGLCTLDDELGGKGRISLMVLEPLSGSRVAENEAEKRYFPVLVPAEGIPEGGAVAMENGELLLLQCRKAFRFSKNVTVQWTDSLTYDSEYSHVIARTKNRNEILPLLRNMWTKDSGRETDAVFPLSSTAFARVKNGNCDVFSLGNARKMTQEETENVRIGMELLKKRKK